jgi:predicted metal-dependent hydrolase
MIIQLDELSIEVIRKPIKHMYLRINASTGEIKISAPLKLPLSSIQRHVTEKREWIHRAQARLLLRKSMRPTRTMSREEQLFLGKTYTLITHRNATSRSIVIEGEVMHYFLKAGDVEKELFFLQQWYKQQMHALVLPLIQKWSAIVGVSVQTVGIKAMKTRWGSCNVVARRIWLNLNLIQKPVICLEYVLVHELVHLLEASHNKRFHALMTQFMPEWKQHKRLLEGF